MAGLDRRRLAGGLLAGVVSAVLALVGPATGGSAAQAAGAAQAAPPSYVALGDSYSSGVGTRSYILDGTTCQRSVYAYPSLLAAARGYALSFRACSGATVADVRDLQLPALSGSTGFVTISVGGNDAGFAQVLSECALPWWASNCHRAIDRAQAFISGTLPGRLSSLYAAIRTRAPAARVSVVGYPRLFNGEDCHPLTWFSGSEMTRLNQTADLLNGVTATQAAARGLSFANPTSRFVGHAVCDDLPWLNGLTSPVSESFHPNRPGHARGYLPLVGRVLTGGAVSARPVVVRAARASTGELAAAQRRYAALDAAIEPQPVVAPDLSSPRVRAAAERAGIDVDRWLARHR